MVRAAAAMVAGLLVLMPLAEARQTDSGLFVPASTQPVATDSGRWVTRSRLVTLDAARLAALRAPGPIAADAAPLTLNLFPDQQLAARIDRVEPTASGYVLRGQIPGDTGSSVALAVADDVIAGKVTAGGSVYSITHVANGVHVIQQIDQTQLPREAPPLLPPPLAEEAAPPVLADDGSTIDLLVVYTPSARSAQGGTSSIQALIDLGVSDTNQAYANSGVTQRLRLVHKSEISYTEAGNMQFDLTRLQATSDGFMDNVHSLRNGYGADLVHLIVNSNDYCGIAYLMTSNSTAFAPNGFGVTYYQCIQFYTMAHELGHNTGLHHDIYVTGSSTGAYPYSRGYVNQAAFAPGAPASKRWFDIMSYYDQCNDAGFFDCTRLNYYSNPSNVYTGDPMGNSSTADGARSLNQTAISVANFRASIAEFTDPTLTTGVTPIKAVHVTELRTRINAVRSARGLAAYVFTDASPSGMLIKTVHITEMRTALEQAYTAAGLTLPAFTDSSLTNVMVKALHITELRAAVIAIE